MKDLLVGQYAYLARRELAIGLGLLGLLFNPDTVQPRQGQRRA